MKDKKIFFNSFVEKIKSELYLFLKIKREQKFLFVRPEPNSDVAMSCFITFDEYPDRSLIQAAVDILSNHESFMRIYNMRRTKDV